MDPALFLTRLALAAVFAVAGAAKLADLAGSRTAVTGFGVPERLAAPLGTLLPFAELATAALLLPAVTARAGAAAALALLVVFCVGVAVSMARGKAPECHCFGQLRSEPVGWRTLVRNLLLAAVAGFAAFAGADAGPGVLEVIGSADAAVAAAVLGGLVLVLVIAGAGAAVLSLLRQNGRLLLRVEALEGALDSAGIPLARMPAAGTDGLAVGTAAPGFDLPGLGGESRTLDSLVSSGRPALLIFTSPHCESCEQLMPRVAGWERRFAAHAQIAVIAEGERDEVRADAERHRFGEVLIDTAGAVADSYEARVTPSAVIVNADGLIGSPVASGDAAIARLVEGEGDVPPGELDVIRVNGSGVASAELPDVLARGLDGAEVSIRDALDERERVLLFWDADCGYCRGMLDDLLALESSGGERSRALLVISRGAADANEAQGIAAPILLDESFAIGQAVGARGTPSAVRIDAGGRVSGGVAAGGTDVLALISNG